MNQLAHSGADRAVRTGAVLPVNEPRRPGLPHVPALDGLRGLALAAVLVYHAEPSWLPGGMLSVTVFFTLSGFLITSLLLTEIELTGTVDLPAFWMRRARRLVPASIAAVALVALVAAAGLSGAASTLIGDAISALTWSANWRFVADGSTYDSLFGDPSPLQHFWSLAVEEQVYLGLPLAALVLLRGGARRRGSFAAILVAGIAASTWAAAALHVAGETGGRAYYGTDARLAEPLLGALLALCLTRGGRFTAFGRTGRRVVSAAGCLALAGLAVLFAQLSIADGRLYRGGFLSAAGLSAVVLVAATQPTVVARILSVRPLARLGLISYGVYLFHWPIFLWVNDRLRGSQRIVVVAVEIGATLTLAVVSHVLLELPIRRRHRSPQPLFTVGWAGASVTAIAVVAAVALPPAGDGGSAGASEAVDLGLGVDDPVPPPPSIVAPPVVSLPDAPAPQLTPPDQAAAPAPAAPPAPLTPEEEAILTGGDEGSDWGGEPPAAGGGQLRVAVVGDSLAHNLATGLTAWAEERTDVVVYDLSVSFCPLSRGGERRWEDGGEPFRVAAGCSWWDDPSSERSTNLAAFAPEVIVSEAGFSEMLDRRLPAGDQWLRPGDREYHEWLVEEYGAMAQTFRSAATSVAILTLNVPCGDYGRQRGWRRISHPDDRVRALDRGVYPFLEGGARGDLDEQLCPNGEYNDELWGIRDARPDGMHLSDEAAAELARRWLGPLVLETAGRPRPGTVLEPAPGR